MLENDFVLTNGKSFF